MHSAFTVICYHPVSARARFLISPLRAPACSTCERTTQQPCARCIVHTSSHPALAVLPRGKPKPSERTHTLQPPRRHPVSASLCSTSSPLRSHPAALYANFPTSRQVEKPTSWQVGKRPHLALVACLYPPPCIRSRPLLPLLPPHPPRSPAVSFRFITPWPATTTPHIIPTNHRPSPLLPPRERSPPPRASWPATTQHRSHQQPPPALAVLPRR